MLDRLRRPWAASLCAAVFALYAATGLAQSAQKMPPFAAPPASDTAAVTAVRNALEAMGGENNWGAVRSSRIQVSACPATSKTACTQRTFIDDWSGSYPRYKRGNHTYRRNAVTAADGSRSYQVKLGQASFRMPEYDAPRVLAEHMPGAALAYVLDHPKQYVLRTASSSTRALLMSGDADFRLPAASDLIQVKVLRLLAANGPAIEEQQWFLSTKTGLPRFVRISLPNLTNGASVWQRYDYTNFAQTSSGLLAPSQVKVSMPNGSAKILNLSQAEVNPALSDADFAFGGQQ
jgi:hypothetical protein